MKLVATGPVIRTWSSFSQSTWSLPPSRTISALRPVSPLRAAATKVAQAPEPQARVMPTPRSQTRRRMQPSPCTWATSTLVRSGNIAWLSITGPTASRGTAAASATK